MASENNKKIVSGFTGGMDQDSSDRYIQEGDYRMLKNGIIDQSGAGKRYVAKNLRSTTAICDLAIEGVCIGAKLFKEKIYAFYYNTITETTQIYKIDINEVDDFTLLVDKDFGHTEATRIDCIDIIENTSNGDYYCYFIDDNNQPFKINLAWTEGSETIINTETVENKEWIQEHYGGGTTVSYLPEPSNYTELILIIVDNTLFVPNDTLSFNAYNNGIVRECVLTFVDQLTEPFAGDVTIGDTAEDTANNLKNTIYNSFCLPPSQGGIFIDPLVAAVNANYNIISGQWEVSVMFTEYYWSIGEIVGIGSVTEAMSYSYIPETVPSMPNPYAVYEHTLEEFGNYRITFYVQKTVNSLAIDYAKIVLVNSFNNSVIATYDDIPIYEIGMPGPSYEIVVDIPAVAWGMTQMHLYPSFDGSNNEVFFGEILVQWEQVTYETIETPEEVPNEYDDISEMYVIRKVPNQPQIVPYIDNNVPSVNMNDKAFQFAQRWTYNDGERTPLSFYSKTAFYPKTEGFATTESLISYYIYDGELYSVTELGTPVLISSGYDTAYNRVASSANGSVVVIFSDQADKPVLVSVDYGENFAAPTGFSNDFIRSVAISGDGKYIYMIEDGAEVWKSDDYGSSFSLLKSNPGSGIRIWCDTSGKTIYYSNVKDVILPGVPGVVAIKHTLYISNNYGETFKTESFETDTGSVFGNDFAVSPNGKYILFTSRGVCSLSKNYGDTFTYLGSIDRNYIDIAIDNNGVGIGIAVNGSIANIYRSDDFFETSTLLDTISTTSTSFLRMSSLEKNGNFITSVYASGSNQFINSQYSNDGIKLLSITSPSMLSVNPYYGFDLSVGLIQNIYNKVDVSVEKPNRFVKKVHVYAIDTSSLIAYEIGELYNEDIPVEGTTITFTNSNTYRVLPSSERNILFSNVPVKAYNQAIVSNYLIYGNYFDGANLPKPSFSVTPVYENRYSEIRSMLKIIDRVATCDVSGMAVKEGQELVVEFTYVDGDGIGRKCVFQHTFASAYTNLSDAHEELSNSFINIFIDGEVSKSGDSLVFSINTGFQYNTLYGLKLSDSSLTYKDGHGMRIGICYYDEYNRWSYPVFGDSNVVISKYNADDSVLLRATINHTPPDWAVKYKFVRTDADLNYEIINSFKYVKYVDGRIWLMKKDEDYYMPEEGMYLDTYDRNGNLVTFVVESKQTKEADFIEGSPLGDWIVVRDMKYAGFSADDIINTDEMFSSSIFYARSQKTINEDKLFFEINGEYTISGGYHQGNVQTQTSELPAICDILNDGNCFWIDNYNAEVNKINSTTRFINGGRAAIKTETAGRVNRYATLCFSYPFIDETGYNGLSMFDLSLPNYLALGSDDGAITRLMADETNLRVWQEDECGYITVNKDVILSATGSNIVSTSNTPLGAFVIYAGTHGTLDPESVASSGIAKYFVDKKRNAICRLGGDGVTEISDYFMVNYFDSVLSRTSDFYGAFNPDNKEYWLYDKSNSTIICFDEKINRWTRTITPVSIDKMIDGDKYVYTFLGGKLYTHNTGLSEGQPTYGTIHDEQVNFELEYIEMQDSHTPKVYNSIELESNRPVNVDVEVEDNLANILSTDFEKRESEYFAYVPFSGTVADMLEDFETQMITPFGVCESNTGVNITMISNIESMATINHEVYYLDGSTPVLIGDLVSVSDNIVEVDEIVTANLLSDKFVYAKEKSYINARNIRGNTANVKLKYTGSDYLEIYTSGVNITKSNN